MLSWPQLGQPAFSGCPHALQNLWLASFWAPQLVHTKAVSLSRMTIEATAVPSDLTWTYPLAEVGRVGSLTEDPNGRDCGHE